MTLALAFLLALGLSLAQGVAAGHAAKYGDEQHTHHGVPCVISVFSHHDSKAITAAVAILFVAAQSWLLVPQARLVAVQRGARLTPRSRAPPSNR